MQIGKYFKDNPAIVINAAVALIAAVLTFTATIFVGGGSQEVKIVIEATQNAEATLQPRQTQVAQTMQPIMTEIATRSTVQAFESNIELLETRVDTAEQTREVAETLLENQLTMTPQVVIEQIEVTRMIEVTPLPINLCKTYEVEIGSVTKDNSGNDVITVNFSSAPPREQLQIFLKTDVGNRYWPKRNQFFNEISPNQWVWIGDAGISAGAPVILVAILGESGQALVNHFHRIGDEHNIFPALEQLTDDIYFCDQETIIFNN